mgnify:CR=1 FL=1
MKWLLALVAGAVLYGFSVTQEALGRMTAMIGAAIDAPDTCPAMPLLLTNPAAPPADVTGSVTRGTHARCACLAASRTCAGVGKSGSPWLSAMTLRPSRRSWLASRVISLVAEGLAPRTRRARKGCGWVSVMGFNQEFRP